MEGKKQHFWPIILYYFKKGKNATETKNVCAEYGEGAVSDRTCQKWFATFHAGDFSVTMLYCCVDQLKLIAIKWRN